MSTHSPEAGPAAEVVVVLSGEDDLGVRIEALRGAEESERRSAPGGGLRGTDRRGGRATQQAPVLECEGVSLASG